MRTPALFGTLLLTGTLAAEPVRKNVILLIADDLGMEVGCYGVRAAWSPNFDALALKDLRPKLRAWQVVTKDPRPIKDTDE